MSRPSRRPAADRPGPRTTAAQRARLVRVITSANPDGTPGGTYQLAARGLELVNAEQMGGQPLALALGLAAAAVLSLALTVLAWSAGAAATWPCSRRSA